MNLFILHCRGATVYAAKPNCAEAESNANEFIHFALPRRNSICGEAEYLQKLSECNANEFIHFALPRRNSICVYLGG